MKYSLPSAFNYAKCESSSLEMSDLNFNTFLVTYNIGKKNHNFSVFFLNLAIHDRKQS